MNINLNPDCENHIVLKIGLTDFKKKLIAQSIIINLK
jgi:hypothetical protein